MARHQQDCRVHVWLVNATGGRLRPETAGTPQACGSGLARDPGDVIV